MLACFDLLRLDDDETEYGDTNLGELEDRDRDCDLSLHDKSFNPFVSGIIIICWHCLS